MSEYTKEMEQWFIDRTNRHIDLVKAYLGNMFKYRSLTQDEIDELVERGEVHDASKFEFPEYDSYVWISWMYKKKAEGVEFEIPGEVNVDAATLCHILNNSHHPEYWQEEEVDLLNREDRDGIPEKIIDATKMPYMDIVEMCADFCAMSEEKGTNTPYEWAEENIGTRWEFTEKQQDVIYDTLEKMWED